MKPFRYICAAVPRPSIIARLLLPAMLLGSQITTAEFKGPGSVDASRTVDQALVMEDGEDVVLIGWIRAQMDDEHYRFEDETDDITARIDSSELAGLEITPRVKVRLVGEIDEDIDGKMIEVRELSIAEPSP